MRRISFIITILFLFILLILLNLPPINITIPNELENYLPNQKFLIKGIVTKETYSSNSKIYHIDNELKLHCDFNCPNFLNQNITATSILETFNEPKLIVLKISS